MFKTLRFPLLVGLLALPLAGCEGLAPQAFQPDATAPAAAGATPLLARGRSFLGAGNYGLAADAYRKAVEARPDDVQGWIGLAAAYDELRRFDLADRAYGQALQLGGPTVQLLNNRGYSHLLRGDYAAARRDLAAARKKAPGNAQVTKNIALLR